MFNPEVQEDLEIEEVEPVDFLFDSPYYYDKNPDNVDFIGWRELV